MHRFGVARPGGRIAAETDNVHVEGFGQTRQASANAPEADDDQRLAAEFVLALRQIADHAAPDFSRLVVARLGQAAGKRQNQADRMFGDRARVHPGRTGQPYAAFGQCRLVVLVGAGADGLDEFQPRGRLDQSVVPHAGRHDDIRLLRAPVQLGAVPHLETGDTGVQGVPAGLHLVGGVGETNGQRFAGRDHGGLPQVFGGSFPPTRKYSNLRPNQA